MASNLQHFGNSDSASFAIHELTLSDAVVSLLLCIFQTVLNNGCFRHTGTCIVGSLPMRNTTLVANRLQVWRSRLRRSLNRRGLCGDLNRRRSNLSDCTQLFTGRCERPARESASEYNCAERRHEKVSGDAKSPRQEIFKQTKVRAQEFRPSRRRQPLAPRLFLRGRPIENANDFVVAPRRNRPIGWQWGARMNTK